MSYPALSYFFAKKTTSLKLCSISESLALSSPSFKRINKASSSSLLRGGGNLSELPTKKT